MRFVCKIISCLWGRSSAGERLNGIDAMLMGPYPINEVASYIAQISAGVYILSRDARTAAYVGRSDTDVCDRIKQSAREGYGYTHFWFEYAPSPKDAYELECYYYHKYNPPDNTNHPAVSMGTNWRCPILGCPWS